MLMASFSCSAHGYFKGLSFSSLNLDDFFSLVVHSLFFHYFLYNNTFIDLNSKCQCRA